MTPLKVSIACQEGFIGEDMFFYAGPGALRRAELAKRILDERFKIVGDLSALPAFHVFGLCLKVDGHG